MCGKVNIQVLKRKEQESHLPTNTRKNGKSLKEQESLESQRVLKIPCLFHTLRATIKMQLKILVKIKV